MYCQVFLSGVSLKVAKGLKDFRTVHYRFCSLLIKGGSSNMESPKCRSYSSSSVPLPVPLKVSTPPKEKLMNCLKDIRGDANATRFCGLLLEANLIIEQPKITCKLSTWREHKTNEIADQLKKVIAEDKTGSIIAERLTAGIYAFISGDHSDKTTELLPLLSGNENSESLNLKHENSEEYLKHMIKALESHFRTSIKKCELFPRFSDEDTLHNLESLRTFLNHSSQCKADCLLHLIFDLSQHSFSEEEKKEIGSLMIDAIEPIERCISDLSYSLKSTYSVFQKRSSLQFLVDDYAKFPARKETLLVEFYMGKINDTIKLLDNFISRLCKQEDNRYKFDKKDSDEDQLYVDDCWEDEHRELEDAGATNLPNSHTWWATYSKKILRHSDTKTEWEDDQNETEDGDQKETEDEGDQKKTKDEGDQKETEDEGDQKKTKDGQDQKEAVEGKDKKEIEEKN